MKSEDKFNLRRGGPWGAIAAVIGVVASLLTIAAVLLDWSKPDLPSLPAQTEEAETDSEKTAEPAKTPIEETINLTELDWGDSEDYLISEFGEPPIRRDNIIGYRLNGGTTLEFRFNSNGMISYAFSPVGIKAINTHIGKFGPESKPFPKYLIEGGDCLVSPQNAAPHGGGAGEPLTSVRLECRESYVVRRPNIFRSIEYPGIIAEFDYVEFAQLYQLAWRGSDLASDDDNSRSFKIFQLLSDTDCRLRRADGNNDFGRPPFAVTAFQYGPVRLEIVAPPLSNVWTEYLTGTEDWGQFEYCSEVDYLKPFYGLESQSEHLSANLAERANKIRSAYAEEVEGYRFETEGDSL